jgi:DNA-binding response OmpR family regulator
MKKILIIDDDPDILEAVQLILELHGYVSEITTKGEEAYSKVTTFNPDLIILDVLLSGSDGREICKKLKNDSKTQHIPILMMSAHPNAKQSVRECGADSFVAKPFSVKELTDTINRLSS